LRSWLAGGWNWRHVHESLFLALPLLPHDFMAAGLVAADRLILARYRSVGEVGVYSVAYTLGIVMALVTNSLQQAWGPAFFKLASGESEGRTVVAGMTTTLAVGLAIVAVCGALVAGPFVTVFLDSRYRAAAVIVPWVIGGYLLHSFYGFFQLGAVQARRTQLVLVASASAFLVNLVLNFWWVPRLGIYGAAYATFVAYGVEAFVMAFCAQRYYKIEINVPRMGAALVIFCSVMLLTQRFGLEPQIMAAAGVVALGLLIWMVRNNAWAVWAMLRR